MISPVSSCVRPIVRAMSSLAVGCLMAGMAVIVLVNI
jgi:hypothetical protein